MEGKVRRSERLPILLRWHRARRPRPVEQATPCEAASADRCADLGTAEGPEQVIRFRQAVLLEEETKLNLGDPVEQIPVLALGCTPVSAASASLCLDLQYEQRWFFHRLGPVRSPRLPRLLLARRCQCPSATPSASNSTGRRSTRSTTEQSESTISDKDVLNVTRSSSKTDNWTVNANASMSLPAGGEAGSSASVSQTVNETIQLISATHPRSTQKSASNLKALQKVQIRESTEVSTEATSARRITNPYRDRSVRIDVYELAKEFCVEFHLTGLAPALVLTVDRLTFDRSFVLTNRAFLSEELIDRPLEFELTEALQSHRQP